MRKLDHPLNPKYCIIAKHNGMLLSTNNIG